MIAKRGRWVWRTLVLLACLASLNGTPQRLVVAGAPRTVETRNGKIGVHTRLTDEVEPWKIQRTLEMVRDMGSPWIVEYFPWAYYEPSKGHYDWAHPDLVVEHALAQGLTVIARIDMVPAWARPLETTSRYLARENYADYANFVNAFARHFRGKVKYVVIWNEPNLTLEWGQRPPDPVAYAELLALAYARAKEADPNVQVLAAGLAPTLEPPGSPLGLDDLVFLESALAAGAGEHMDGLALHAYGLTFSPDDPADRQQLNFSRVELLHDALVRAGRGDLPCYITEGGWNDHPRWTRAVRVYERMAYTVRAYDKALREWPWCRAVCLWVFRYPWPQGSYQDYSTFVTPGFIPKPIYGEVRHYARGEPFEYIMEGVP
jgi:polysaccharide biosynthesis protein PslG